jgi:hypothetical protein
MNRKQFTILLLVLVIIGIAGLVVYRRDNTSTGGNNPALGKKVLPNLPYNDVATIVLKDGSNQVDLVKTNDLWRVQERNNYPANYSEISEFLLKWKDLKVVQSEEVGAADLRRLSLVPDQGTNSPVVVELKDASGKAITTLLLGKKHMRKSTRPSQFGDMGEDGYPDGRYITVGTSSKTVALISDPLANVEPKPEQWLNKDFFKVEKPRSISVLFPNATNSWKLVRETETAEWKLGGAQPEEKLDSSKVSGVSSPFSSPSFNDVVVNPSLSGIGLENPTLVTVETFDNFTYTVKVGAKTNEAYALSLSVAANLAKERTPGKDEKPEDKDKLDKEFKEKQKKLEEKLAQEKSFENWVYLVSSWSVDNVLKERAQLMVEKKDESKPKEQGAAAAAGSAPDTSDDSSDSTPSVIETDKK